MDGGGPCLKSLMRTSICLALQIGTAALLALVGKEPVIAGQRMHGLPVIDLPVTTRNRTQDWETAR